MSVLFQHKKSITPRDYLRNLIFLGFSDGKLDELESTLIFRIGQRLGLDQSEIIEIIGDGVDTVFLPESFTERMNFLFDVMQVLYSDGHANREELEFVRLVVEQYGLSGTIMDKLINLFQYHTPTLSEWSDFVDTIYQSPPVTLPRFLMSVIS
jgi:uncharacterized tellurite resistance protein B-like protein